MIREEGYMFWEELREEEFDKAVEMTGGLCVVPIGCFEMHGEHLPVSTDVIQAEAFAEEAAKLEPACIFPAFRFGDVAGLVDWKGGVRLDPELILRLLENLCDEIARNGFKKIMFVNYHGGNVALLDYFVRSCMYKKRDYIVTWKKGYEGTSPKEIGKQLIEEGRGIYPELLPEDEDVLIDMVVNKKPDGHGGVDETSAVMVIRPDLVNMDREHVVSGYSTKKADELSKAKIHSGFFWNVNYPNSYHGHAVGSSERIGKLLMRLRAEDLAKAYRVLKEDVNATAWYEEHSKYY